MTDNSSGPQHFRNYTSNVSLHYKYNGDKWFISNYVGVSYIVNKNNSDKISEVSPTLDLYANYTFNSNNSAYLNVKYERMNPSQSYKTDELLQQNEIIFTRGNPYLKNYNWMKAGIGYNWNPSNIFHLGVFGNFAANFDRVIQTFGHYRDGSALLRSYMNSGNFYNSNVGVSFTLNLLKNSLTLQCSPTLSFYKSTGLYSASYNPFGLFSYATYYLKQFYFQGYYQTEVGEMDPMTSGRDKTRTNYGLTAGMSRSGWNISVSCQNIFNKGFRSFSSDDSMPLAKINSQSYMSYYGPAFNIRVTYTFGYGKKVQRGDEVGQQRVAGSAIMN